MSISTGFKAWCAISLFVLVYPCFAIHEFGFSSPILHVVVIGRLPIHCLIIIKQTTHTLLQICVSLNLLLAFDTFVRHFLHPTNKIFSTTLYSFYFKTSTLYLQLHVFSQISSQHRCHKD